MTYEEAKAAALKFSRDTGEKYYIAECEVYAVSDDEFTEGNYIVGNLGMFATCYDKLEERGGKVVAVTSPDGSHFCNDMALTLRDFQAVAELTQ